MASGGKTVQTSVGEDAPAWLIDAEKDLGVTEWVMRGGKRVSNPQVERYIEKVSGQRMNARTTAWCAFWLGAKLEYNGLTSTKSGMARSYLNWGQSVADNDWKAGDVVVLRRGQHDDGVLGHVGFLVAWDDRSVTLLGGNQGDAVTFQKFQRNRILGVRRPRSLWSTKTVRATAGAGLAQIAEKTVSHVLPDPERVEAAQEALDAARPSVEALSSYKPWLIAVFSVLTIVLIVLAALHRSRDFKSGKNT